MRTSLIAACVFVVAAGVLMENGVAAPASIAGMPSTFATLVSALPGPNTLAAPEPLSALASGSDSCATPDAITGNGPFPFSTVGATTGAQGQSESACSYYGTTALTNDVWFAWTASFSGTAEVSLCDSTAMDSKVAVYAGTGCPSGSALACDDDSCCQQSRASFACTLGNVYTIQLGNRPTADHGVGSFTIYQVPVPDNDDCADATPITGMGPFAFDLTHAHSGTIGQGEFICSFNGETGMRNDVWFEWTAPFTGTATAYTCGQTAAATKIGVYSNVGGPCPTQSALACSTVGCGAQTRVSFPAIVNRVYTIQIAVNYCQTAAPGTFMIDLPPANDDCANPTPIAGVGAFPFNNLTATTGSQGQTEAACFQSGQTGIGNDLWYDWTASATGTAKVSLCGGTTIQSKLAVYAGSACPTAPALTCNARSCGDQSEIAFAAALGSHYLIQLGDVPNQSPGSGTFTITIGSLSQGCAFDDGTAEAAVVSGSSPTEMCWLTRFGTPGVSTTITSVSAAWGQATNPGFGPPNGSPSKVAVWSDPDGNGSPTNAVLQVQVPTTVQNVDTDILTTIALPSPITVSGYFFVGVTALTPSGTFPAPIDHSAPSLARTWTFANNGPINLANPSANNSAPHSLSGGPFEGVWLLRANCALAGIGQDLCLPGQSGVSACPCGNPPTTGKGCNNSAATGGAILSATGNALIATDTFQMTTSGELPNSTSVFSQGQTVIGSLPFGQGVRCMGGSLKRLYTKMASGGVAVAPTGADITVSSRSANLGDPLAPGITRYYHVYYRDPNVQGGCPASSTFNVTQTVSVLWAP